MAGVTALSSGVVFAWYVSVFLSGVGVLLTGSSEVMVLCKYVALSFFSGVSSFFRAVACRLSRSLVYFSRNSLLWSADLQQ
ncbi:MAG: hypothetical protein ACK5AV_03830 [Alphaproteobacteria bacterium]